MHRPALVVLLALSLTGCARTPPAASASAEPATPRPTTSPSGLVSQVPSPSRSTTPEPELAGAELAARVDGEGLLAHLEAIERIAREPSAGGTRATGTIGFESSASYVAGVLGEAGYVVERQEIDAGGVPSQNLLAERAGAGGGVIVVGAHLDSVLAGPGINDNGSGVATLLVIAQRMAALPAPTRTIRFAFWGAEEGGGLFGSAAYVESIDAEERAEIVAYLNFDMLASPNAVRFVYKEPGAAPGSSDLTEAFATYFEDAGLPWEPIDLSGDSDHGPFRAAGIPTGGLFSGGIEPVTDAQAATFGAVAGEPADACSHRACDTIDNVDLTTLEQMADAIAHVLVTLATTD